MLVLSRKPGEKVILDGGITITVVKLAGNQVRLGIEAPAHVGILRGELIDLESDPDLARKPRDWSDGPDAGCLASVG